MRLKVSPKAAVQAIDSLVKAGTKMRQHLHSKFEKMQEDISEEIGKKEADHEAQRQQALQEARNEPDLIEVDVGNGVKLPVPNSKKHAALMRSAMPEPMYIGGSRFDSDIAEARMKELRDEFASWRDETKKIIEDVFMDFTPVYSFMDASGEWYTEAFPFGERRSGWYINMTRELDAKIAVLIGFYKTLSENIRSPLTYLPNQAKLCFYDMVCPLKTDSNEASLCTFMFQHSIGEKVEMIDVYNHIFGEQETILGKTGKDKIKNAVDGINRKTNKSFGFAIIAKDSTSINLTIPARVTQSML